MARGGSHYEKGDNLIFVCIVMFCTGHYPLEVTGAQSWPDYIGPKREKGQVCLTRPVFTPFLFKVAWSGISRITGVCISYIGRL